MTDDPLAPTVLTFLERIFPFGTIWPITSTKVRAHPNVRKPPFFQTDVFGAAALLVFRSGAVSRLLIGMPDGDAPDSLRPAFQAMEGAVKRGGIDLNDPANCAQFRTAGEQWAQSTDVPMLVRDLWARLVDAGDQPVHHLPATGEPFPAWWTIALALMIIADEACDGLGYGPATGEAGWLPVFITRVYWRKNRKALGGITGKKHTAIISEDLPTMCFLADADVLCVQPKVRTPAVGCTLRSYTHNVALLPPRGVVSTGWQHPPGALNQDESAALNLLIVPYPFAMRANWFSGKEVKSPHDHSGAVDHKSFDLRWGWFQIEQEWLLADLVDFTEGLIREAQKDVSTIHGVLFPEYAMDWKTFERVKDMVLKKFPKLEFIISGSSSNCINERGNFVLSAVFLDTPSSGKATPERAAMVSSRWKHHRWRLNESQISNYALGSALDPRIIWWEAIALGPREVDFTVFRSSSAFTTLICEDLARSDPCHAVLRDVGPNLVFVMLMDGPQLESRWSARYSTTLADDPGCSVLTYTSLALVERSNRSGIHGESRIIGLWKDDTGKTVEIPCPSGAHGVVLSLSDYLVSEATLDGRPDHGARAWRFHNHYPITLNASNPKLKRLLDAVLASAR